MSDHDHVRIKARFSEAGKLQAMQRFVATMMAYLTAGDYIRVFAGTVAEVWKQSTEPRDLLELVLLSREKAEKFADSAEQLGAEIRFEDMPGISILRIFGVGKTRVQLMLYIYQHPSRADRKYLITLEGARGDLYTLTAKLGFDADWLPCDEDCAEIGETKMSANDAVRASTGFAE